MSKKSILFWKQAQLSLLQKNAWSTRREEHTKKLESNSYAGTLPWKVFMASQAHWKWSDNIFPRHRGKRVVRSESMTKFSTDQILIH